MINKDINVTYLNLCECLLNRGYDTGDTIELGNVMFTLTDLDNNITTVRDLSFEYLCGEMLWYITARNDIDFIHKFSTFWSRLSDDGITCNSAYGDILFKRHGFNQVEKIIELLKKDKNSRRAVLNLNVPNENVIETNDEICTIALVFKITDNKLNCTGIMRSNDIYLGLPYDVAFFTSLQKYIANRLGIEYGYYTHFVTNLHFYKRDFDKIKEISVKKEWSKATFSYEKMLENSIYLEALVMESNCPKKTLLDKCIDLKILEVKE